MARLVSSASLAGSVRCRLEIPTNHAATFHMSPLNSKPRCSGDVSSQVFFFFISRSEGNTFLNPHTARTAVSLHSRSASSGERLKINSCKLPHVCACSVVTCQSGEGRSRVLGGRHSNPYLGGQAANSVPLTSDLLP